MSVYGGKVPKGTRNARTGFPVGQTSANKTSRKPPHKSTCVCMVMAFAGGVGYLLYQAAAPLVDLPPLIGGLL